MVSSLSTVKYSRRLLSAADSLANSFAAAAARWALLRAKRSRFAREGLGSLGGAESLVHSNGMSCWVGSARSGSRVSAVEGSGCLAALGFRARPVAVALIAATMAAAASRFAALAATLFVMILPIWLVEA